MRVKIKGFVYDTKTAEDIVSIISESYTYPDPRAWDITLYKVNKTNYFLYISGGSESIYAHKGICKECQQLKPLKERREIIPLTPKQAKKWVKKQKNLGLTLWYPT